LSPSPPAAVAAKPITVKPIAVEPIAADSLDALEDLRNAADRTAITKLTLQDLLYHIQLESKAPLFLQLSQRTTGKVDAVIPNTPEAETMAEKMKVQTAAWCHFYWQDTNPGAERFYRKLSDRAFHQVLRHEISACSWDAATKVVISPRAQIENAAIADRAAGLGATANMRR
jgi:hypothetical protein